MPKTLYQPIKRAMDVAGATLGLVVFSPVVVVVAVLVRARLGSPVLFRQQRSGRGGQPFTVVKFRSMRDGPGSDSDRLTPFGARLRSTSLDELPEFWNVLRGDMSLVGPRPLLMEYEAFYDDRQRLRSSVRPGITGLAQVQGRNLLEWPDKLELDARYVETIGFVTDVKILWQTVSVTFKRHGTAAPGHAVGMTRFDDYMRQQRDLGERN